MLASKLFSSPVTCIISRFRLLSSSFNVVSSSLVDCNSSLAVSSSSLVDCSSSLLDSISSLADFNSSLVASCSSMMACNDSFETANSRRNSPTSRSVAVFPNARVSFSRLVPSVVSSKITSSHDLSVPGIEWHSLNIYFVGSAAQLNFRPFFPGGLVRFDRAMDRGPQVWHQGRPRQAQEVECRRTRCVLEKQLGPAAELLHVHVLVDYDRRRRVGTEHNAVGYFQKIAPEICASAGCRSSPEVREFKATLRDEVCHARCSNDSLRVNFVFLVPQFEKLVV